MEKCSATGNHQCNGKPHFISGKGGFARVEIIVLILAEKQCGHSLERLAEVVQTGTHNLFGGKKIRKEPSSNLSEMLCIDPGFWTNIRKVYLYMYKPHLSLYNVEFSRMFITQMLQSKAQASKVFNGGVV